MLLAASSDGKKKDSPLVVSLSDEMVLFLSPVRLSVVRGFLFVWKQDSVPVCQNLLIYMLLSSFLPMESRQLKSSLHFCFNCPTSEQLGVHFLHPLMRPNCCYLFVCEISLIFFSFSSCLVNVPDNYHFLLHVAVAEKVGFSPK